ncbi:MAG: dTDP-4-dehydrorhamnose 3,5-epimerase [Romboutsia sp.]|uniref:dTDP-4-dehydrorhamnose 3,5-epimerase n=1 Tax=Romboutsia sp. TaxID=1965302 RepID=UPI003F32715C
MIQPFSFEKTTLNGPLLINPFVAFDNRGYLIKDYSKEKFHENNLEYDLEEVFYTNSKKGVIRAIHFQRVKEQAKLVRCVYGEIYDVVVDLRKSSPTFGKWEGFYLSEENKKQLFIPEGFGHGYLVLKDSIVSYKCNEIFYSEYDDGILWNDKTLNIDWPLHLIDNLIISDKDTNLQSFNDFKNSLR